MYSDPGLLILAFSFSLAPAASVCSVGHFSFLLFVHCLSLLLCPCAAALTTAVWLVWHQWFCSPFPPLLLTFVCDLSLCLVSRALMRSHCSRRGWGPDFLMFTQMCFISGAVLDEQNVITCCVYSSDYDFLFSCYLSPSLSLSVSSLQHIALWKAFVNAFSPPQAAPFFLFLNWTTMVICQLQVEK